MASEDPVESPQRLASLRSSGLTEPADHVEFDRVTALAARLLEVPVCLVSLVDENRQVFVGACGLPPAVDQVRETPLSHSFCKHAVRERQPLIIRDALQDPRFTENGAVRDLGVIAYLGVPLHAPDGEILGAFCVIDSKPRDWTDDDLGLVRDFTAIIAEQIELHINKRTERSSLDVLIHDLKSPLAGIRMVANLLKEHASEIAEGLRPLVDALGESTDSALHLVESLARRDRRSAGVCPDLNSVLAALVAQHRAAAGEKGLTLDYQDHGSTLPLAVAGWVIEQVAENLLTNAIKFTPAGGTIRLSVRDKDGHGVFEVADDGPGFQAGDYPKLYRRYARMSARPTAGEPSTGLGLSIAKRLVEQEGGTIELLSKPGESAVFLISFPLSQA